MSTYTGITNFQKNSPVFGPPCTSWNTSMH